MSATASNLHANQDRHHWSAFLRRGGTWGAGAGSSSVLATTAAQAGSSLFGPGSGTGTGTGTGAQQHFSRSNYGARRRYSPVLDKSPAQFWNHPGNVGSSDDESDRNVSGSSDVYESDADQHISGPGVVYASTRTRSRKGDFDPSTTATTTMFKSLTTRAAHCASRAAYHAHQAELGLGDILKHVGLSEAYARETASHHKTAVNMSEQAQESSAPGSGHNVMTGMLRSLAHYANQAEDAALRARARARARAQAVIRHDGRIR